MFIPLHDSNALKYIRLQYVTLAIIAVNVLVFLFMAGAGEQEAYATAIGYGYTPAVIHDLCQLCATHVAVPEPLTYVTYAFMHGDLMHLGGNMLFLWVFGDNVEDALGHFRYFLFYIACAAAGAWLHGYFVPASQAPLIGASGAVAGVIGGYLVLHPRVKVWVLALGRIPLRLPAFIPLILWIALQFLLFMTETGETVSFAAHLGGAAAGIVLVILLRRRGVPLFDRAIVTPDAVVTASATEEPVAAPAPAPTRRWGRR